MQIAYLFKLMMAHCPKNFILLTVCEILDPPTCRVVSTRCQAVPRTPPLQWATDNRERIHWMFLAVSCQQRLQSYKQKKK